MTEWVVHKFGGTSVRDAERYRAVADILAEQRKSDELSAIVVSAMSKVTDALLNIVSKAMRRDPSYLQDLAEMSKRHHDVILQLSATDPFSEWTEVTRLLMRDIEDLREVLRAVYLTRSASDRTTDLVAGHGEVWSARNLATLLASRGFQAAFMDAREVLVVEHARLTVDVDWSLSATRLASWFERRPAPPDHLVITGFIAETRDGLATTLGRNGSDYSASIFGNLLAAREIVIWTDVDGVLSADPRKVSEAVVLPELSYDEATELAYFGAKVVHPSTMAPAIRASIPIWIKNTFNPTHPGTKIHAHAWKSNDGPAVRGFATIDEIALINVEGTGMIGVPGVAHRLFGSLKDAGLSVIMISQASSEHSICFGLPEAQAPRARETIEQAFFAELERGQIERVEVITGCSILAAVGDGMVERRGVAGKFFSSLGQARVNVRAIAQGSSERNISAVIRRDESIRALRAVHSGFFLSEHTLSVGIVGMGLIGSTLARQIERQLPSLQKAAKIDLRVRAIANSRRMRFDDRRLSLNGEFLAGLGDGSPTDLESFADHVQADHLPHAVIVDCTASQDVASLHPAWLERGIHVVTANKKGVAGDLQLWQTIRQQAKERGVQYLESTTVGAGLPIIRTLRDLVTTGDQVESIEGVLSGTLSYLFNELSSSGISFSQLVRAARERGYTEPDPRDDLSGADVVRKLVILAREVGFLIEAQDVEAESLVPERLLQVPVQGFLDELTEFDGQWRARLEAADRASEVLRYVASIDATSRLKVGLRAYPKTHAFARVSGTDNIVAIQTKRYHHQPMVIQGPGAGPEVTAGGVFADILKLASQLGSPR